MHDYELREQSNTGFVVNKNLFTYSYATPGTYKVVCVASTYTDGATDLKRDTCSYTVTVIDDQTEIENISCPQIVYDEVFAERRVADEITAQNQIQQPDGFHLTLSKTPFLYPVGTDEGLHQ